MINFSDIKGQTSAVTFLTNSLKTGRIGGSYLFFGPKGVGRALCAQAFTRALVCKNKSTSAEACNRCPSCYKIEEGNHPDITWIKPEKNKVIKIDEIRAVKNTLSLKPFEGAASVCVIEDVHMMTVPAANALLKILEEPPVSALLILITDKKELLLDTVISRCTEVRFNALTPTLTRKIISDSAPEMEPEKAELLAYFSQGSPGRALEMLEEGLDERRREVLEMLSVIAKSDNPDCIVWENDKKDILIEDVEMLLMFVRDAAVSAEGLENRVLDKSVVNTGAFQEFKKYDIDTLFKIAEHLIDMKRALIGNVNPKIAAQVLPRMLKNRT